MFGIKIGFIRSMPGLECGEGAGKRTKSRGEEATVQGGSWDSHQSQGRDEATVGRELGC